MGRIEKLSPHIADLIAAGEVVERPASVVKELMENALDAGAKSLTVELVRGGMEEISVTDDGCGMSPEDAGTAFLRHATSKLRTKEDLFSIGTLGFRGEALAAISAVSRVELTTCEKGAESGTFLYLEAGEEKNREEIGCPEGTVIRVRDLFYNTPARLKFLRKDASEGATAAAVCERVALSHPEVAIRLVRDGTELFSTPGDGDLYACLYCLYGGDFAKNLLPVEYSFGSAEVKGYVTRPEKARGNRQMQNFFCNGRSIRNKILSVALEEACRGYVMVGKFPSCFLYITVDPSAVDVNVHPTKSEVKFSAEKDVFDAIFYGVRSCVQAPPKEAVHERPALFAEETAAPQTLEAAAAFSDPAPAPAAPPLHGQVVPNVRTFTSPAPEKPLPEPEVFVPRRPVTLPHEQAPMTLGQSRPAQFSRPEPPAPSAAPAKPAAPLPTEEYVVGEYRIIGEFARLYVLVEAGEELVVVDKHAVHERILYEELKKHVSAPAGQLLLKPVVVNLSGEDMASFEENGQVLASAGFEAEPFGQRSIAVRSVPLGLEREDVVPLITEMLEQAASRRDAAEEKFDRALHTVACRAAVKAGMKNALPELDILVRRALFDPAIRYCPHGRPVKWSLDKKELEKRFGRSGNLQ